MKFDISQNDSEYDLLLNDEYIGKAITLEEILNKIKKVMEALKDNGKKEDDKKTKSKEA